MVTRTYVDRLIEHVDLPSLTDKDREGIVQVFDIVRLRDDEIDPERKINPREAQDKLTVAEMFLRNLTTRYPYSSMGFVLIGNRHADAVRGVDGFDLELLDADYFTGKEGLRLTRQEVPSREDFRRNAKERLIEAATVWDAVSHEHSHIVFRQARVADIYFDLFLQTGRPNFYQIAKRLASDVRGELNTSYSWGKLGHDREAITAIVDRIAGYKPPVSLVRR